MGLYAKQDAKNLLQDNRRQLKLTPFELGFHMPAEWERHESTWLTWPKDPLTFPSDIIGRVEETYCEMIHVLQASEHVDLLVNDQKAEDRVTSMLSSTSNVLFHQIKSQDVWIRDYGPIFVKKNREIAAAKWIFNAWGGKVRRALLADNKAGLEIVQELCESRFSTLTSY